MPWSEGKLVIYSEMMLEGFDNVKKKFVTASIHNETDTGIINMEGTFDPTTRIITYDGETISHTHRDIPAGTKMKFHSLLKFIDNDHFTLEWHELVDGKEIIVTELKYTRVK